MLEILQKAYGGSVMEKNQIFICLKRFREILESVSHDIRRYRKRGLEFGARSASSFGQKTDDWVFGWLKTSARYIDDPQIRSLCGEGIESPGEWDERAAFIGEPENT